MSKYLSGQSYSNKRSKKWLLFLLIIPFSVLVGAASSYLWYQNNIKPYSVSSDEVIITITEGTTALEIGDLLEEQGLIRSSTAFEWYVRVNNYRSSLQAGGYKFKASESVEEIVRKLVNGDVAKDLVTILPAQSLIMVKDGFIKSGYSQSEVERALDPKKYTTHPALADKPADDSLEGYLYPESYQRTSDTTLEQIIEQSLDLTAEVFSADVLAKLNSQNLTIHQAIILASIVEKEVSIPKDKPIVAQVFLKRYSEGIMLGSDATSLYGAFVAGIEPSVFADTPYNTRIYTGLPPGPIGNVGTSSILAVVNPAVSEYLYFVSGDDGKTYFSSTLAEHEALTAKHCVELCKSY